MKEKAKTILIITVIIIIIAASVFIFIGKDKNVSVPEGAKAGDIYLESDTCKIDSIKYDIQKGMLIVSESENNNKLIALPIIRFISPSDEPAEPIFYLSGGPGSSNVDYTPSPDLLAKHDIVYVGYRGVDGSVILECPTVKKAVKGIGNNVLSEESLINISEAFAYDGKQLQARGIDLDAYTIIDVISDIEIARKALGYERINLLSLSYGTRIAQIYAYQHPDTIYRSIMVSVNPPGHFIWEDETTDRQLEYYSNLYRLSQESNDTLSLTETIRKVSENMPERWFIIPSDQDKAEIIAHVFLYHKNTSKLVFDAYSSGAR